ncbi:hypothetical protein J3F83DRAFT_433592 [Trichoderma novae-zelandiae]
MACRKHLTTDPCRPAREGRHRAPAASRPDQSTALDKRVCSGSSSRIPGGGHGEPSLFEGKVKAQAIQAAAHHTTRRAKLNVARRREGSWRRAVVAARPVRVPSWHARMYQGMLYRTRTCTGTEHLREADEKPSRAEPGRAQTRSIERRHREYARL